MSQEIAINNLIVEVAKLRLELLELHERIDDLSKKVIDLDHIKVNSDYLKVYLPSRCPVNCTCHDNIGYSSCCCIGLQH